MVRNPVLLLAACAVLAHADSSARLGVQQFGGDRHDTLLEADVRLDGWRLGGWFLTDPSGELRQGYGALSHGPWRVGGGAQGDDAGMHVGFAPRPRWRWGPVSLRLGADIALGAGLLEGHRGDLAGHDLPVDVLSLGLGAQLELTFRPHRRAWVTGFAAGDGLAAAVSRGPQTGLTALLNLPLDGGLSNALSEARAGGGARLSLVPWAGAGARVIVHAEERWDWIQLDPVAVWSSQDDELPFRLSAAPWRTQREVGVTFEATQPLGLALRVSGRHTQQSTALERFADRDGWSVAAGLEVRKGHLDLALSGRWHLEAHPAEAWWGERWPRHQLRAAVGLEGVYSEALSGRFEVGGQWTLSDSWGAPTRGHAAFAQVTVWFGSSSGKRLPTPDPLRAAQGSSWIGELAYRPASEQPSQLAGAQGATGLAQGESAGSPVPGDLPLPTLDGLGEFARSFEHSELVELVDDYNALRRGGLEPAEVRDALEQRPQLTQRIEAHFPGLLQFAAGFLPGSSLDPSAEPAERDTLLLLGYGREGIAVSPVRRRAIAHADLTRVDARATDAALTARVDDGLNAPALAARWRLEKLTLWSPGDRRHDMVLQARSSWSLRMRRLLRGF